MKKIFVFIVALAAFAATAGVAAAQEQNEKKPHVQGFISNKFWDNWEIQGGVGPTFTVKTGSGIADANHWAGYAAVGKWFHPVFGVRFAMEGGKFDYLSAVGNNNVNTAFIFAHPDFMVNLSNWIGGYKERVYNAVLLGGAGIASTSLHPDNKSTRTLEYAFNFGLQNRFNVCKCLSVDLTMNYMLAPANLYPVQKIKSSRFNALNFYVGVTYRFNKRTYDRAGMTEAEAKAALGRLSAAEADAAAAKAENERLAKLSAEQAQALEAAAAAAAQRDAALKAAEEKLAGYSAQASSAKEAVDTANFEEILFYLYGYGVLNENNKTRLDLLAEHIKNADSDKVFKIEGFADPQTGSKKANIRLAEKRARLVYEYLVSKGVDSSKLSWKNCGTENLPFGKKEQNRVVVIF